MSMAVTSVGECNKTHCVVFVSRSTQIKTYSWDNAQVVLAGNKCDMEEERVVSVESGRLLAEQLGKSIPPISCACLTLETNWRSYSFLSIIQLKGC